MAQESKQERPQRKLEPVPISEAELSAELVEEPVIVEQTVETAHGEVTLSVSGDAPEGVAPPNGAEPIEPVEPPKKKGGRLRSLSAWVEQRATSVVSRIYESRADDLEERARRVVGSAYQEKADDLQTRAQRALQQAIADQAEVIKEAIEHGVEVKKREVRLSLLVLVAGSLIYLFLYWLTSGTPAA